MTHAHATNVQASLPTLERAPADATFVAHGRTYRWSERVPCEPGEGRSTARMFLQTVVPDAESRGARGLVFRAGAPVLQQDAVRWVAWRVPGESKGVWGLYVAAHALEANAANDAFVVVAWGESRVLLWADTRLEARRILRAALHEPPPWLARGLASKDETFPVTIRPLETHRARAAQPIAVARPVRVVSAEAAPRDVLLRMVQSWRRQHPPSR